MLETSGSWLVSGEETTCNKLGGAVGILSGLSSARPRSVPLNSS